ncbi:MAG: DJ-1/PfpI family protein, partial [Ferrovibrionaceae bacterium]
MRLVSLLFDGITALDIVGPLQVLTHLPGVEAITVAKAAGPVRDRQAALGLVAEKALGDVDRADILLVPGGPGTRGLIDDAEVIDWIRRIHPTTTWTASICTGSLLLGKAGLLTGKQATTHWGAAAILEALGATYVEQRVVFHDADRLVTAAGETARSNKPDGMDAREQ